MESDGELERLRRRLYGPDATEADRARYAALVVVPEPDAPGPAAPGPAAPEAAPRRRARLLLPVAALVAGAALVAWPVVATRPGPAPTPAPTAVATAAAGRDRSGDVERISLSYADAGTVQAFHGRGAATVRLDAAVAPHEGGSMSLVLAPSETAPIGWRAVRSNGRGGLDLLAQRSVTERRGVAVPIDFPFTGDPPTDVEVEAPDAVSWTLVVTALRSATVR